MHVFTNDWVEEMRRRYRDKPRHRQSLLYLIATEAECEMLRTEIERFVADLPLHVQSKVIQRFQSERNPWHTYHELVVGSLVKRRGLQIDDYEREWQVNGKRLTPDWVVSTSDGSKSIIVEVFTQNVSDKEAQRNAQLVDLTWRFGEIRVDAVLKISFKSKDRSFDSRRNKKIAVELKRWLEGEDSKVGARRCVEGLQFQVINRNRGFSRIQWVGFSESSGPNPAPLRNNLVEKVKTYGKLVSRHDIPLVVAVVADIRTGCDLEEFENILLDHLFVERPELSGAIWARKRQGGNWEMKGFANPCACLPMCPELATALCGEKSELDS